MRQDEWVVERAWGTCGSSWAVSFILLINGHFNGDGISHNDDRMSFKDFIQKVKIKETLFEMELGIPEGGALTHHHSLPFADSIRKEHTFHSLTGSSLLYTPQQEKRWFFSLPSQWETTTLQPMKSCHHPEFSLASNELLFKTAPPNFLLSSIKASPFSLFSDLACSMP